MVRKPLSIVLALMVGALAVGGMTGCADFLCNTREAACREQCSIGSPGPDRDCRRGCEESNPCRTRTTRS